MFETMALGRLVQERENSRRSGPVGDEDAMVICLPEDCEGLLGEIVGHLNLLSPWNSDPRNKDRDFFNDQWHIGEELGSRNADPSDNDLWVDGPSAHAYGASGLVHIGSLGGGVGGARRRTLRPLRTIEPVPQFQARLEPEEDLLIREGISRTCPGLYCTDPAYGQDLWQGYYEREPAFWGRFTTTPMTGSVGDAASKEEKEAKKAQQRAKAAADEFERKAARFGKVRRTHDVQVIVDVSNALPALDEIAKNASKRKGVFFVPVPASTREMVYNFATNPATSGVGCSASGVAALQVLLGALDGSIDCGQVFPLGDGQFGVVGANVGKLFDFLKKKNKGESDDAKGGGKGERLSKKIDRLWEKIQKLSAKYKEETGTSHTPWAAAEASAKGFWSVGGGGGGHFWGQPEGMDFVGGRGGGGRGRPKLRKMRQQMKQQRQQKQQSQQQSQQAPEAQPYQQEQPQGGSPWEQPPQAPAQPMVFHQPHPYPMQPMMPAFAPAPMIPGYGGYATYAGSPMVPVMRGLWGEPVFQDAPAATQSPWEGGSGLRVRRSPFDSRRGASVGGFWTDCWTDSRGAWGISRNWDGQ